MKVRHSSGQHLCNLSAPKGVWEADTWVCPGACRPASLDCTGMKCQITLSQTSYSKDLLHNCTMARMQICVHIHTETDRETKTGFSKNKELFFQSTKNFIKCWVWQKWSLRLTERAGNAGANQSLNQKTTVQESPESGSHLALWTKRTSCLRIKICGRDWRIGHNPGTFSPSLSQVPYSPLLVRDRAYSNQPLCPLWDPDPMNQGSCLVRWLSSGLCHLASLARCVACWISWSLGSWHLKSRQSRQWPAALLSFLFFRNSQHCVTLILCSQ